LGRGGRRRAAQGLSRGGRRRATGRPRPCQRRALESLGLQDRPSRRLSQDDRDAIAAAWTARLCSLPGAIEWFGEIAVPEGHS
jgi:hypothetical protein